MKVHNKVIVVPKNVDTVCRLTRTIKNGKDSIRITYEAM